MLIFNLELEGALEVNRDSMSVLQIRLFGGLDLAWDGVSIPLISSSTSRSLLAYLVTYRDRPHTRDLLAGTFWPDLPDATARRRLSQAGWHIRRALAPHSILSMEGDTIQFKPDTPVWIDHAEFTRCYRLLVEEAATKSLEQSKLCVEYYRGEFLAGYYDDWILSEREQLRNMYLAVLRWLAEGYKSQGQYENALIFADRLANENPWSEEGVHEVMRLYHLLGRNAEALKQYENLRHMLTEEMGVEPSPDTKALAVEIASYPEAREAPWLPSAALPSQAPLLEHPDRIPLVGRKVQLAAILNQLEAAARGEGGMFIIYGEMGIGKTRLLQELALNAQWRGIRNAWGRCYELTGPPAYQPLVEVFRTNLPALSEPTLEQLWRAELARFLPELATDIAPTTLKPEDEQNRLLEAISRGFQAFSKSTPYLVILEDAHWMDPSSLASIRYLLPRLEVMRLLLVISARRSELSGHQAEIINALENTRLPHCMELDRLNLDETSELVQRCLELEHPPPHFGARLYAETEGNPFFLTETLRTLLDEGLLYRDESGVWSTPWDDSPQGYAELPLPKGIAQSIKRRLERLPSPVRKALNLAAVIGRGVSFELWLKAADLSEAELLTAGDDLCRRGMLSHATPGVHPKEDYTFVHDQIRRVTYDQLAPPRLRFYHRRVAEALFQLVPEKVEALAFHWTTAGIWDKAMNCHQKAGERASAMYANDEAVEHYSKALEVLEHLSGPPDLERIYEIRLALVKLYDLLGNRQMQTQELVKMSELSEEMGDVRRRAEVFLLQAKLAARTSDYSTSIAASRQAIRLARLSRCVTIEAESCWELGWAFLLQGERAKSRSQFERSLTLARSTGMRSLEAEGLHGLGTISLITCEYPKAKEYFHQVLNLGRQPEFQRTIGKSLSNLGYIATAQGDHAASKSFGEQALKIYREIGDQRGVAIVIQNLSDELQAEGDFKKAKTYLEEALAIQEAIQARENAGETLRSLGLLFHQLGDYSKAKECYEKALAIFNEAGIRYYQSETLAFLSLLYHHQGNNLVAVEMSLKGLNIAEEIADRLAQGWLLDSLGHARTGLGELKQAAEAYQQSLELRRKQDETHKATEPLAGLARVALIQGNISDAKEYVEEILCIEKTKSLDGTSEPFRIYLTCFQVLEACRDPRAESILASAYEKLNKIRSNIDDEALERSFMENVAANREINAVFQEMRSRRLGSMVQVKLPRAEIPHGRPLRDDKSVTITWTVSAPEDENIRGKIMQRQHRLMRLLQEARSQGADPTYDNLAEALRVTRRTIERDMAVLRQRGVIPPTKRRKMSE